jgi:hypothetical protein
MKGWHSLEDDLGEVPWDQAWAEWTLPQILEYTVPLYAAAVDADRTPADTPNQPIVAADGDGSSTSCNPV